MVIIKTSNPRRSERLKFKEPINYRCSRPYKKRIKINQRKEEERVEVMIDPFYYHPSLKERGPLYYCEKCQHFYDYKYCKKCENRLYSSDDFDMLSDTTTVTETSISLGSRDTNNRTSNTSDWTIGNTDSETSIPNYVDDFNSIPNIICESEIDISLKK